MKHSNLFFILFSLITHHHVIADEKNWIDLIPEIEPAQNTIAGNWYKNEEGLNVDASQNARLTLPFNTNSNYEIRTSFTRTSGIHSIALFFTCNNQQAGFELDAWGQNLAGIQLVDGMTIKDNQTRVNNIRLENNKKYLLELQVLNQDITVKLDSTIITELNCNTHKLSMLDLWKLPDTNVIGIGAYDSAAVFHSIQARQIGSDIKVVQKKESQTEKTDFGKEKEMPDDLSVLSDEFEQPASIDNWLRIYETEGTNANQLEKITIDEKLQQLELIPYTSSWYEDYRGVLVYKPITGNFIAITKVQATGRNNSRPPNRLYSLAGIMVRTPRNIVSSGWSPGGENYIFLSTGAADQPGVSQFEVKTTVNSVSNLEINTAKSTEAEIMVARLGGYFILLKREGNAAWAVHRRYHRPDMPETLQVGMTVYTDWKNVERISPTKHNQTVIKDGQPDLRARFDYFRFSRVTIPERLKSIDLSNKTIVSDDVLLDLLVQ